MPNRQIGSIDLDIRAKQFSNSYLIQAKKMYPPTPPNNPKTKTITKQRTKKTNIKRRV